MMESLMLTLLLIYSMEIYFTETVQVKPLMRTLASSL